MMLKYMDIFDDVLTRKNEIGHFYKLCVGSKSGQNESIDDIP